MRSLWELLTKLPHIVELGLNGTYVEMFTLTIPVNQPSTELSIPPLIPTQHPGI